MQFSTFDATHDLYSYKCPVNCHSGWWHKSCYRSNPNGLYNGTYPTNIAWMPWHGWYYSLKTTEMKISPEIFGANPINTFPS